MEARDGLPESLMNACLILEALDELRKLYNYRVLEYIQVDMNLEIMVSVTRPGLRYLRANGLLAYLAGS